MLGHIEAKRQQFKRRASQAFLETLYSVLAARCWTYGSQWVDRGPQCDLLRTAADIMRPVNKHLSPLLKGGPTQTGSLLFPSPSLSGMLQMVKLVTMKNKEDRIIGISMW